MSRKLLYKFAVAGLLMLALMLVLSNIRSLMTERIALRDTVLADIAHSASTAQTVTGPLLVVPYKQTVRMLKQTAEGRSFWEEHTEPGRLYFMPDALSVDGKLQTELRSRGIYQARLYHAGTKIGGHFVIPANYGISDDLATYEFGTPFLTVGLSDIRGIENAASLTLNNQKLNLQPGSSASDIVGSGIHAMIPGLERTSAQQLNFAIDMKLLGTSALEFTPVGRETSVQLVADWPHPSFIGDFLPREHQISAQGFSARWQTSFFATNMADALKDCTRNGKCDEFSGRHFGVSLVDPVDHYLKSERAIKYALLFISMTFGVFFLFEVLKKLSIHPIQYGLVGLALAVFYLLLVALSEHMAFALAYLTSSLACVLLLLAYATSVLHSIVRGLGFGSVLTALYGMLYVLLNSEDYSLLMGAILVFGTLATAMLLTRKVDWSTISGNSDQDDA